MDPSLLRERENFKKRALTTPAVEKRKNNSKCQSSRETKKPKLSSAGSVSKSENYSGMSTAFASTNKFCVLAKIVKHLHAMLQSGDQHPLTLEEILDETNQLHVSSSIQAFLKYEALPNNPKIKTTPDGKFLYKSLYKLTDRKSLVKLLKRQDLKGSGGIYLEDIKDSLPHAEKVLKILENQKAIQIIKRPRDKKESMWNAVAVDAIDDSKIDEYLKQHGHRTMAAHGLKKPVCFKRKRAASRKSKKPRDNEHLADVLETYKSQDLHQQEPFVMPHIK